MKHAKILPGYAKKLALLGIMAATLLTTPAHALYINLTTTGNATADTGFREAADFWQGVFTDNITVNITAGFAALGANILGQASSTDYYTNFSDVKTALTADATSADDATMVAGLPGGSSYSKLINRTAQSTDNYVRGGITELNLTTANAKAIGLLAANGANEDAAITFSNTFGFDFDASNGITAGLIDFVGVAIHEIGHALGFISGVDVLDYNSPGYQDYLFDPYATLLDFTRCSSASETAGADMDWTIGDGRGYAGTRDYAINGSCSGAAKVSNAWSTGYWEGDGRQASHWKDNLGLGIMDPTFSYGELGLVSALDVQAFDVIGWDLKSSAVPEPASLMLFVPALAGLAVVRRRKKSA